MTGRVFVSCGQGSDRERDAAKDIEELLDNTFGLNAYVATQVQGLNDIMRLTDELRAADYYLFIDFKRELNPQGERDNRNEVSVFAHQELALAYHREFDEIIALQEQGVKMEGFLRYVQSNPETFDTIEELLDKVEKLVESKEWHPDYSRNLNVDKLTTQGPLRYTDHTTGEKGRPERIWHAHIQNRRPDTAAENVVAVLQKIEHPNGDKRRPPDTTPLKWANEHQAYSTTILPGETRRLDLFAQPLKRRVGTQARWPDGFVAPDAGILLHSRWDRKRPLLLRKPGTYTLHYKVYAQNLPLLEFSLNVTCNWEATDPSKTIEAKLPESPSPTSHT